MVVSVKLKGVEDLQVHGAISRFEMHFHDIAGKPVQSGASNVVGAIVWSLSAPPIVNVSLLKCDGEWVHIGNIEKLLVEET